MNLNPPVLPEIEKLERHILADKPRITKFNIEWDDKNNHQEIPTYNNYNYMFDGKEDIEKDFKQMNQA